MFKHFASWCLQVIFATIHYTMYGSNHLKRWTMWHWCHSCPCCTAHNITSYVDLHCHCQKNSSHSGQALLRVVHEWIHTHHACHNLSLHFMVICGQEYQQPEGKKKVITVCGLVICICLVHVGDIRQRCIQCHKPMKIFCLAEWHVTQWKFFSWHHAVALKYFHEQISTHVILQQTVGGVLWIHVIHLLCQLHQLLKTLSVCAHWHKSLWESVSLLWHVCVITMIPKIKISSLHAPAHTFTTIHSWEIVLIALHNNITLQDSQGRLAATKQKSCMRQLTLGHRRWNRSWCMPKCVTLSSLSHLQQNHIQKQVPNNKEANYLISIN